MKLSGAYADTKVGPPTYSDSSAIRSRAVAVILSLIFWYWMWGVPGAILTVPMLAIIKIICDRLQPFRAFGHLLEG